jgi:hypothetical protein
MKREKLQQDVCAEFDAAFSPAPTNVNSGFALGTEARKPIHGLRHRLTADTTGWYIWCGEFSEASDFFKPIHTAHLDELLPDVVPFLGLPPGYRFMLNHDLRDVWFDPSLLNA